MLPPLRTAPPLLSWNADAGPVAAPAVGQTGAD